MRWLRRSPSRSHRFRLLFATDLHGANLVFRKLVNAALAYEAQAVLIGGDLTGKILIPVVHKRGTWQTVMDGKSLTLESRAEVWAIEQRASDRGEYVFHCTEDELCRLEQDHHYRDQVFVELMQKRLMEWAEIVYERLNSQGIRFLWNCGNDDPIELDTILAKLTTPEYLDGRALPLYQNIWIISVGGANLTPWRCPRDMPEAELSRRIDAVVADVPSDAVPDAIFNLHCPPYNTGLDIAPRLDENLSPVVVGGVVETIPVGSTAVRAALERYQPQVSLHGHIHESRAVYRLGRTLCLNPGSEYQDGILRAAVLDFVDGAVRQHLFVSA